MNFKKKIASKLNGAIRRTHWFNEELFPDCRKFWNYNTFNTDVINLGSTSGCHAFDYEDLPIYLVGKHTISYFTYFVNRYN